MDASQARKTGKRRAGFVLAIFSARCEWSDDVSRAVCLRAGYSESSAPEAELADSVTQWLFESVAPLARFMHSMRTRLRQHALNSDQIFADTTFNHVSSRIVENGVSGKASGWPR
jgi:ADP-ribosylglycohydrolase